MPTPRVERQVLLPHRWRKRAVPFLSILLTSFMTITVTACGAADSATVQSPLSAVPPTPGMILVRNQSNTVSAVVAVNLQNGRVLWQYHASSPSAQIEESSPMLQAILEEGLVYLPQNYQGVHGGNAFGELIALDAATGQEQWKYKVVSTNPNFETNLDNEPVEANGVVYLTAAAFVSGGSVGPPGTQRPQYFLVQAVDSHTGTLLWSRTLTGSPSTPTVADGNVLVLGNNALLALRPADGSTAWSFDPAGTGPNTPVEDGVEPNEGDAVSEGQPGPAVFSHLALVNINVGNPAEGSTGIDWFAVNTRTGKEVWENTHGIAGGVYSIPVLNQSGDVLCTSAVKWQGPSVVQGLSLSTGKTLWSHSMSSDLSICAASGNTFYLSESNVTGTSGGLLAFDSQTGKQLWQTATPHPGGSSSAPAPPQEDGLAAISAQGPTANGQYLLTGPVTVIQLSTGKVLWQQDLMINFNGPILAVDNEVLIPVHHPADQFDAYSLQSGSHLWTLQFVSGQ